MSEADAIVGLGARSDFVATAPQTDRLRQSLTPDEVVVLAVVGRASPISEVIDRSGMSEPKAISLLLSLRAKGAIVPARVSRPSHQPTVDAGSLEEVDLDPARKQEILEMERALDYQTHFEFLGVEVDADTDAVRKAYHELSRKFHPDRYFQKNLGSFRGRVEKIFRRLTEANITLSDPTRRAAYLAAHPEIARPVPKTAPKAEESPERLAERRARLATHPYLMRNRKGHELLAEAKALMAKDDYPKAMVVLDQATRLDPKNTELSDLLQQARRQQDRQRAENELKKAQEAEMLGNLNAAAEAYRQAIALDPTNTRAAARGASLILQLGGDLKEAKQLAQRAVDGEPNNASYRALLAKLLLSAGMKKLAKKEYEETLRRDPDHAEAKAQLRKLRWTF